MEIKSNKINGANAEIKATISMDEVNANIDKIAKNLAKTAKIDGFRKGKVPMSAVKKQYGERLVQDGEAEAIRDVLDQGLKEMEIDNASLIGEPNISQFDKSETAIEVTIKIAMRPAIDLGDYAAMAPEVTKPVVSEKEVETRINDIAQNHAPLEDIKRNRKMKEGDTAVIDFEGSVDGVLFEGGTAENFALLLGSGQFIPGFEEQLIGAKRDDALVVQVTFPAEYNSAELAGKDAEFKVKVNQIQVKGEVVLNDELAAKLLAGQENATMEELTKQVRLQMEAEALSKLYNDDLKPALLESFVTGLKFDLPEFVVEQEIDMALNKKAGTMSEEEVTELKENADKLNTLRETFRGDAEKSVRATFIIDALALAENVKVEEQEVMQTIYYEAMQMGQDPQAAFDQYKKAGYIPAIQMSMVEDKVLSALLNAKIKEA